MIYKWNLKYLFVVGVVCFLNWFCLMMMATKVEMESVTNVTGGAKTDSNGNMKPSVTFHTVLDRPVPGAGVQDSIAMNSAYLDFGINARR